MIVILLIVKFPPSATLESSICCSQEFN